MRKIPTVFAFTSAMAAATALAGPMPLSEALTRMENGNHSLQAQERKVNTTEQQRRAARGNFLPVVRMDVGFTHLDRDIVLDMDPIRDAMIQLQTYNQMQFSKADIQAAIAQQLGQLPADQRAAAQASVTQAVTAKYQEGARTNLETALPHFVKTSKEQNDWDASITAYQPLFHGGRILAAQRVAFSRERAAFADLDRQKNDLRRDFTRLYLQGSLLRSSIALRNEAIGAILHHRDRAKNLVDQGMADRAALLRAEMALAEAKTSLSDDSSKLESIALTLAQMAGQEDPIVPADSLPPPPDFQMRPEEAGREIAERNPLIRSIAAQQEVAHRAVDVRNADFLPEIGAFGKYEFNQDAAKAAMAPCWVVGVKGSINLFRGGGDWYSRSAARSTEVELAALRREAESALAAQSKRQFLTLRQCRTRHGNLLAQADLARENHRVTSMRFEQGLSTSLEVVDAWLSMQKADLERLAAAGDAWISAQEILWAAGRTEDFAYLWNGARK